jgi:L-seryl-tRNA(Ser) seleniumtransferase
MQRRRSGNAHFSVRRPEEVAIDVNETAPARLRALPSVQRLLEAAPALVASHAREGVTAAIRAELAALRDAIRAGATTIPDEGEILARLAARLADADRMRLRRVINATGIVLHTNLGRAPLAREAIEAVAEAARGYANLEYDLATGRRGSRYANLESLLAGIAGAESALVVNNNAAAVLLALTALASGAEVIVSRGELVEIGGGFRIPDVIRQGGARLVEVGATNRTRLADYADAITPQTRVILKVHPSNYRMVGFTHAVPLAELAPLAHAHDLLLVEDLGSGTLTDLREFGRPHEPTVQESIAAGADLVAFSGDKLLGGPQAGLLVGRADALAPLRRHPLLRALRIDKLSLAALEATLRLHRTPERIPVLRMLAQTEAILHARAELLAALIPEIPTRIDATTAYAGGGSLPESAIASRALVLTGPHDPDALAASLRAQAPPVIARIAENRVILDMLTIADDDLPELAAALRAAAA